ncbi:hypothetical protein AF335_09225 [Streptomyces eurocidicus]|uniref:Uncharacterized protein n=1 Tax=Streptomyces eurocidicus TaxID=66423 RepID=A0A2N8P102_STREU|nr:hypothetical protein [Streptomyces eurocidicus]MBB5121824.1 hypothetical protein [Streptomyces eurocidicus]MBF6055090.1 hypothetical protein [Streptomyces eurocidicus]PNE34689.1 hypothetical protein AF335_09225 [Streptomyces eurocidicus]
MDVDSWFVVEDPAEYDEEPWDFDEAELAFLAALRSRAAAWRVPSAPSQVGRPEDDSSLLVDVTLIDSERPLVLGEWAVHFYGTHVRAGKVCDQLHNLHESPGLGFFHASGPVEELAERCADWFESLLSRPVVRTEWSSEGGTYATSWEFADTGEALVRSGVIPADGSPPARRLPVRGSRSSSAPARSTWTTS